MTLPDELLKRLPPENSVFSLDFETPSLEDHTLEIASWSWRDDAGLHSDAYSLIGTSPEFKVAFLAELVRRAKTIAFHNFKFDGKVFDKAGYDAINLFDKVCDTLIMAKLHMIDRHDSSLGALAPIVGREKLDYTGSREAGMEQSLKYAATDAEITFLLYEWFREYFKKYGLLVAHYLESETLFLTYIMERNGIRIDLERAKELQKQTDEQIDELHKALSMAVGTPINFNSSKQLSNLFYNTLKMQPMKEFFTGKGAPSTKAAAIEALIALDSTPENTAEFMRRLLEYKKLAKLRSSFLSDKFFSMITPRGRIHPTFNSMGTETGRYCVAGDTLLSTSMGEVAISELALTEHANVTIMTHRGRQRRILRKFYKGREAMYRVTLADGSSIKCTHNHRFLTPAGWRSLKDIALNDTVYSGYLYDERREEAYAQGTSRGHIQRIRRRQGNTARRLDEVTFYFRECGSLLLQTLRSKIRGYAKGITQQAPEHGPYWQQAWSHATLPHFAQGRACANGGIGQIHLTDRAPFWHVRVFSSPQPCLSSDSAYGYPTSAYADHRPLYGREVEYTRSGVPRSGKGLLLRSFSFLREALFAPLADFGDFLVGKRSRKRLRLLPGFRTGSKVAPLMGVESLRAYALCGVASLGHTTYQAVHGLQELLGRLLHPLLQPLRRSRRRVSHYPLFDASPRQDEREAHSQGRYAFTEGHHCDGSASLRSCRQPYSSLPIVEITSVGIEGVWDIEVEEDHSYVAHGFINHNSSSSPNQQNIPRNSEDGKVGSAIRSLYVASPGKILISVDFSQIELRLLAHFTRDPVMVAAFRAGQDLHQVTADLIGITRSHAKNINFGLAYGLGATGLARNARIAIARAASYLRNYYDQFRTIKPWKEKVVAYAYRNNGIRTISGRFRNLAKFKKFEDGGFERRAVNTFIQGSAADLLKYCTARIFRRYLNKDLQILMTVHDELLFECDEGRENEFIPVIKDYMENTFKLFVPVEAEPSASYTWLEAKG